MGESMKFAGLQGKYQPDTRAERAILANEGSYLAWPQSAHAIVKNLPNCSARPKNN